MNMNTIKQDSPMKPKRAEELDKTREKLQKEFDKISPPDNKESKEYKEYKEKESFLLRLRRAISWLGRAQQMETDVKATGKELDTQFIFLWVSFNALYGREPQKKLQWMTEIRKYFRNLLSSPEKPKDNIYKIISGDLKESFESLRKNKYISKDDWNREMRISSRKENLPFPGWKVNATEGILCCVFQRLYVLRNQLMHGASTWGKTGNKDQLVDGAKVMHYLLPIFIEFMLKSPEDKWKVWGEIWYPRMDNVSVEGKLLKSTDAPKNYRR